MSKKKETRRAAKREAKLIEAMERACVRMTPDEKAFFQRWRDMHDCVSVWIGGVEMKDAGPVRFIDEEPVYRHRFYNIGPGKTSITPRPWPVTPTDPDMMDEEGDDQ